MDVLQEERAVHLARFPTNSIKCSKWIDTWTNTSIWLTTLFFSTILYTYIHKYMFCIHFFCFFSAVYLSLTLRLRLRLQKNFLMKFIFIILYAIKCKLFPVYIYMVWCCWSRVTYLQNSCFICHFSTSLFISIPFSTDRMNLGTQ